MDNVWIMENGKRKIVLVIHNVRSAHNVGSLLRTAEGLGAEKVYITGYSPYPEAKADERLPHIRQKITKQISKTALGAEKTLRWEQVDDIEKCLSGLADAGFLVAALEQTTQALDLNDFYSDQEIALVVGNEVEGLDQATLDKISVHLKIPMLGQKESFNVAVAGAIALYRLRYLDKGKA
jgi:23S rRNA (guanosine2251-2'-O)-methyltransferase